MRMLYAGLDIHKRSCYGTVLDKEGNVVSQAKFENEEEGYGGFFRNFSPEETKVVIEATSCWVRAFELLEARGFDVQLAHPLKTRAIAEARIKTDAIDSAMLAHLLRADLIAKSHIPCKQMRELREVVRHRVGLARLRAQLKNKIHAILSQAGVRHSFADLFCKKGLSFLLDLEIREKLAIKNYIELMEQFDKKICTVDKQIEKIAKTDKNVALLTTIPGIANYSALLILSEISDINRFPSPKHLCSYSGLVPTLHQSGNVCRTGSITKQGSKLLRWILVQCTWVHIKKATRLQLFYKRIAKKKGNKKAVVATARKLLTIIYWMLNNQEEFHDY